MYVFCNLQLLGCFKSDCFQTLQVSSQHLNLHNDVFKIKIDEEMLILQRMFQHRAIRIMNKTRSVLSVKNY